MSYSLCQGCSLWSKELFLFRLTVKLTRGLGISIGKFKVELKFCLGQPAITRLDRFVASTHRFSHYFAT